MAESIFDQRYRYDYIYPRGRSGETLRAIDIETEQKVVVKRPAPNDAPPIRAGQEVSIKNERQALRRLAGHPVLTELLGEGQFTVGGMAHQYIVIERAEGRIIEDEVLALGTSGDRLPQLEMLLILDRLLDLLHAAHAKDIVYNDVDAKHLFWNRDDYTLKAIDWGNAVFLEGDEMTAQGISRQTDVFQIGELLYFIVTGGKRAELPRDAEASFAVDFGDDQQRIDAQLRDIISRALHPNTNYRYPSIQALRNDLNRFREPLERSRSATLTTVRDKLKQANLSKNELRTLKTMMEPVIRQDPGYPQASELLHQVNDRLQEIEVASDLDAVKIYLKNGNWQRAIDLLNELRHKTSDNNRQLIGWLYDIAHILHEEHVSNVTEPIVTAIDEMYDDQAVIAAAALMEATPENDDQRRVYWRLAERISSHATDILLLRPNLMRLRNAMRQINTSGTSIGESRGILDQIDAILHRLDSGNSDVSGLRDGYREVVDHLIHMNRLLQTFSVSNQLSNNELPLSSLERALNAAMALADNMHVIGKQAAARPRVVQNAIITSRAIDTPNPIWDSVEDLLSRLYERLQACQTYVPTADGSDLADWLKTTHTNLSPFVNRLFDDMLSSMVRGLQHASDDWQIYREAVVQGNRELAESSLSSAASQINTLSPTLQNWFNQLRSVIGGAHYIERHSVPGGIGRALADGWQAFDSGRLPEAERLGQQALEIARSESERFAATRLREVTQQTREWVERNGVTSVSRTQATSAAIERLFTEEERATLDGFTAQMPSIETYLRAMPKGLVSLYAQRSTAALRLLFVQYVMLGTLDLHEGLMIDAEFWREAALKVLGDSAEKHIAVRTLDDFMVQRKDLTEARDLLNSVNGSHILPQISNIKLKLENNAQARQLASGARSLRELEEALRAWGEGDFRTAGGKLDSAVKSISEVEQAAGFTLTAYRAWLMDLMSNAADLAVAKRELSTLAQKREDDPNPRMGELFHEMAHTTHRLLGNEYAATLISWRDTYEQFVEIYTGTERRSRRLDAMNDQFRALFIDRHPAYALFRHWYAVLEASPEFPAPPTDDPTPHLATDVEPQLIHRTTTMETPAAVPTVQPKRRIPIALIAVIGLIAIVASAIGLLLLNNNPAAPIVDVTISATADETVADAATDTPSESEPTEDTPVPADTEGDQTPTAITSVEPIVPANAATDTVEPTEEQASETPTTAATITPTEEPTATPTPTPTKTPTERPTLPAEGLRDVQDVLAMLGSTDDVTFDPAVFFEQDTNWRLGAAQSTGGDDLFISPSAGLMESTYGNNAVGRVLRTEVTMALRTINPAVAQDDDIYFGLLLASADDGNVTGIRINVVSDTVIDAHQVLNDRIVFANRRPSDPNLGVRLRIDRDLVTGQIIIYVNDDPLGQPYDFFPAGTPVVPMLFVHDGGVIVGVTNWTVTLS
ncbi:MAG: hypothetical protein CL607_25550 [Anaerolineaceae bacterium]|nr:hypothetical protein [Anaerolineaceae bacterium]